MFLEPSTSLPDTKDTDQSGKQMKNIFDEQKISLRPSSSRKNVLRWHFGYLLQARCSLQHHSELLLTYKWYKEMCFIPDNNALRL